MAFVGKIFSVFHFSIIAQNDPFVRVKVSGGDGSLFAFWRKIGILFFMVTRMRHTRSHTGNRRSHHALEGKRFAVCSNCEAPKETHLVCKKCGFYRGRKVLDVVKKVEKKQAKKKASK